MTIKAHGGVFQRNPSFNNVEVQSLTVDGNVVPDASTILVDSDIGSTIQGYDADTAKYDDVTANFTGTLQNGGSNVLVDTDIGSTVQAYDADTAKLDVVQTFSAAQTFNGGVVFNAAGADVNFQVDSDTRASALFFDGGTGQLSLKESDTNGPWITGAASSYAAGASLNLTSTAGAAIITVYNTGSGAGGVFFATYSGTVVKLAGDGAVADSGSDSITLYKSSSNHVITYKNRSAATVNIVIGVYSSYAF